MIKTRFIVAIGLLMTLACCSNSGTDQTPDPNPPTPPRYGVSTSSPA